MLTHNGTRQHCESLFIDVPFVAVGLSPAVIAAVDTASASDETFAVFNGGLVADESADNKSFSAALNTML